MVALEKYLKHLIVLLLVIINPIGAHAIYYRIEKGYIVIDKIKRRIIVIIITTWRTRSSKTTRITTIIILAIIATLSELIKSPT